MVINNHGEKVGLYFNLNSEKIYIEIDKGINEINFYNHIQFIIGILCSYENINAILNREESRSFVCPKTNNMQECSCLHSKKIILDTEFEEEYNLIKQKIEEENEMLSKMPPEEIEKINQEIIKNTEKFLRIHSNVVEEENVSTNNNTEQDSIEKSESETSSNKSKRSKSK